MLYQPGDIPPEVPPRIEWREILREWVRPLLIVVIVSFVMNLFFPRYYVKGQSMEPQLHEYDWLFTVNVDVPTNDIQRGDIIVLVSPYDGELAVKRVIGLPGEQVNVHEGKVYIDGVPLEEDYLDEAPNYYGSWEVGPDQYFVLGDNRNHSLDSGDYGPIDASRIRDTVRFRLWPPADFGRILAPDYLEAAP
ncbi:MAG: signal peptidase I [Anaerolineae bacterium]|nr:signal peptidase I [Anaerolineae bacterium]